jgi:hypothetical protein
LATTFGFILMNIRMAVEFCGAVPQAGNAGAFLRPHYGGFYHKLLSLIKTHRPVLAGFCFLQKAPCPTGTIIRGEHFDQIAIPLKRLDCNTPPVWMELKQSVETQMAARRSGIW